MGVRHAQVPVQPTLSDVCPCASTGVTTRDVLIQILLARGEERPCSGRAVALTMDPYEARELRGDGLSAVQVERLQRLQVIVSPEGELITVMHRYKHRRTRTATVHGRRK
jgi:hypothetical protein